ncbi:MAG: FlgD immunoglobulin-like domain containing protein [candidate division FCPU426 bacterium]
MKKTLLFSFLCLLAWQPALSLASMIDAQPQPVGFDGQRYSASSRYNVVARVELTADASGGTLNSIFFYNDLHALAAEEGLDIVSGSTRLWYAYPDTGSLNTTTAQLVGTFTYYSPTFWELVSLNQWVRDSGCLYVTVDITAGPRENAICAFYTKAYEMEFDNYSFTAPSSDSPASPPAIYLTSYTAPTQLDASASKLHPPTVSTGQTATFLEFTLDNVGGGLTGPVFLSGLTVTVRDQGGAVLAPNQLFDSLGLRDSVTDAVLSFVAAPPSAATGVYFPLAVSISAAVDRRLKLFGTVTSNTATAVAFRLGWEQAADADARYLYTGAPVTVAPASGFAFPLQTDLIPVQLAASQLQVYHTPGLPDQTVVLRGDTNVAPVYFTFLNPGTTGTSRVDVTHLTLTVTDGSGNTLSPASVFTRVAVTGSLLYGEITSLPATGSDITISLSNSYIGVPVYQPVTVTVQADIHPTANTVAFRLQLAGSGAVVAQDANTLQGVPVVAAFASDPFPMISPTVRLASSFLVTSQSLAPATLYPGQQTALLDLTFTHPGPADLGPLVLLGLTLTSRDQNQNPVILSAVCSEVLLRAADNTLLGQAAPPAAGSQVFLAVPALSVAPFASARVRVEVKLLSQPQAGTFSLGLEAAASVSVTQPLDPTRPVYVSASWPLFSAAAAVGGGEGRLRLANYPNPFGAGRESTRIAYYLASPSTVTAVLYTLAGDQVCTLAQGAYQAAGEQVLVWNGRTASGAVVRNGVYLLRLEAVPAADGSAVIQVRKVAVVK